MMSASTCHHCHRAGYCDLEGVCPECRRSERNEQARKERADRATPCRDCGERGHELGWWGRCAECQEHHDLTAIHARCGDALARRIFGDRLAELDDILFARRQRALDAEVAGLGDDLSRAIQHQEAE